MLQGLVGFSLRFRGVVIALACVVTGYGIYTTLNARFDVYPEFAPPLVVVQTEAPGLSPEEVEALVTRPVENAVNGAGNLESVRSQSIQGLSVVTAIFREGTDVFRARQTVSERLSEISGQIPQGVKPPAMAPLTSATSMMLVVGLASQKQSLMELRTAADWTVRPRLLGVPGVAKVVIFGGEVRQIQVQVIPDRLLAYRLTLDEVMAATRKATGVRGAGFIDTDAQRIVLQTQGQTLTPEAMGEVLVAYPGRLAVRLKDVARVVEAPEPKMGAAAIGGRPGVLLVVSSQFGANTLEVTEAVERALEELKPGLEAASITLYPDLFRPASFIQRAIRNVTSSLLLGGVLVAAVLFLFLFNLRTAFISLTAIPLSLLIAVIVLDRLGLTLNTLTLGGLAIAIGEVVDDAIIDVENIFRRLRQNAAGARSPFRVVLEASLEVRSAVVYATFVVALVFVPVLTMSGLQGRLFAPLGIAYILAILASLAVALTVTPALCYVLLRGAAEAASEPRFLQALKARYVEFLALTAQRPRRVIGATLALCAAAAAAAPFFGGAFLPELQEGHFIVHMAAAPGTSLEESLRLGRAVTLELLKNPRIRSVAQQAGRAESADDTWGPHYSEFHVDLQPLSGEEGGQVQGEIRAALSQFPGVYFAIKPFLTERIEEVLSGVTAEVVIKIFGDDLEALDRKAREVAPLISSIRGAADVQVESPPGLPQVFFRLRPERLRQFGFHRVDVLEAVRTAYQGSVVAQTYEANRVFNVAVILDEESRRDPENLGGLRLHSLQGPAIPLRELVDVYQTTGRFMIVHDGARRRQSVTCNVRGRDVASFVAEAKRKIQAVSFPPGVYAVFSGAAEASAQARRELLLHSSIAGVGVVLAVFLTGGWLTVGALVGFVTLFGITTRNSIMMISHFERLVTQEGMEWGLEAALRGASERLAPILMTALVTALGLLPLALGSGEPGREIEGPMALVILGGLATSTLLNLLVLPALALRYGRFSPPAQG